MEIKSKILLEALRNVSLVIKNRSTLGNLTNVVVTLKNGKCILSGSDLENRLDVEIEAKGSDGSFAVNCKRFKEVVAQFVKMNEETLTIGFMNGRKEPSKQVQIGTKKCSIYLQNKFEIINELTMLSEPYEVPKISFVADKKELERAFDVSLHFVSTNEFRVAMMGVRFSGEGKYLRCVATDGHRLNKIDFPRENSNGGDFVSIIQQTAITIFNKIVSHRKYSVRISIGEKILFSMNDGQYIQCRLYSRLIDEQFPNWEAVIPKDNNMSLLNDRKELLEGIELARLASDSDTNQIRLIFTKKKVLIESSDAENDSCSDILLSGEYEHSDITIGFNGRYLLETLEQIKTPNVTLRLSSPTRACIIEPEGDQNELYLVMPVRLQL